MPENIRKYSCLIFDWDGTLMDSASMIVEAVRDAALESGLPVPQANDIRLGIGTSFDDQFNRLFGAGAKKHYNIFKTCFYKSYALKKPVLFPGVENLLASLLDKGCLLTVATSGSRRMLNDMFARYDVEKYFALTCTADDFPAKPNPEMLLHIISSLDVNSNHAVMIGDNVADILAGENAGIDSIGVLGGVCDYDSLLKAGAKICISSVNKIIDYC